MAEERSTADIALDLTKLIVEATKGTVSRLSTAKEILDVYGQWFKKVVAESNPD